MDNSTIVLLINDECRAIEGVYEEGGSPTTFKTFDPTIKVDDYCVVQSTTRHELTTVKVTDVDVDINFDTTKGLKWVVQKIDMPYFETILSQEAEAITAVQAAERKRKKAELRKSLMADHEDSIQALTITKIEDDTVTE